MTLLVLQLMVSLTVSKPLLTEFGIDHRLESCGLKFETYLKPTSQVYIDGPFGAPSDQIFRAEHAVLIGAGIGVTPFASILQSIMRRFWKVRTSCHNCSYQWTDWKSANILNLRKVSFYATHSSVAVI